MDNGIRYSDNNRVEVVDSIRGFAIAAIFLIHTSNHFLYNEFPNYNSGLLYSFDSIIRELLYFLFEGKAYSIFAILLGFTLGLQLDKKRAKGVDFRGRMVWRTTLLAIFGVINAALFAGGDPLIFYAVAMLIVIPISTLNSVWIALFATIALIQPLDILNIYHPFLGDSYIEEYNYLNAALCRGELVETIYANITFGIKGAILWGFQTGRFSQTLGLIAMGILCYRYRVFSNTTRWSRFYPLYAVLTVALYFVYSIYFPFAKQYYNLLFTITTIAIFMELYRVFSGAKVFKLLAVYGRMSLSNFVAQSLLGGLLFYPYGLNLAPYLGVTFSVAITLGLIAFQIFCSYFWLSRYSKGPLEYIWNRCTLIGFKQPF